MRAFSVMSLGLCLLISSSAFALSEANDINFEERISNGTVVVDFYSHSCPHCVKFAPTFRQVAQDMSSDRTFITLNVKTSPKAAKRHGISRIPTVVIFEDGNEVKRRTGGGSADSLKSFIQK